MDRELHDHASLISASIRSSTMSGVDLPIAHPGTFPCCNAVTCFVPSLCNALSRVPLCACLGPVVTQACWLPQVSPTGHLTLRTYVHVFTMTGRHRPAGDCRSNPNTNTPPDMLQPLPIVSCRRSVYVRATTGRQPGTLLRNRHGIFAWHRNELVLQPDNSRLGS